MPTALLSVSNKTGIVDFAKGLLNLKWDIISSGGTADILRKNNVPCAEISQVTGFPEILDGRVKTLNPKIHGGILAMRSKSAHLEELKKHSIGVIDLVAVNLYPFEETASALPKTQGKIAQEIIENIDIGGVALLRAAGKNYKDVLALCDICDYEIVLEKIRNGRIDEAFKLNLAAKVFRHTAYYDGLISQYLSDEKFPSQFSFPLKKMTDLRYGENPHQKASLYCQPLNKKDSSSAVFAKQIHGKEMSFNNYLDLESAWRLVNEFTGNACAVIKHNNPCGCAIGSNTKDSYLKSLLCDPVSAFGGILAFNNPIDADTASEISSLFVECVIAPSFSKEALDILEQKKNIRLLEQKNPYKIKDEIEIKQMTDGILLQDKDNALLNKIEVMTKRQPSEAEKLSLDFAWKVSKFVKSNAIVLVRGEQTVGIGAGQMSRIDSLYIALKKMSAVNLSGKEKALPLVLASDAFFPFADVVLEAAKAGVSAIIQPGGSLNDKDSIKAADENNIAMLSTNMRHFKH